MVGFTVITRTSRRPNFFRRCRQSVLSQTHPSVFHLIISDEPADRYPEGDFICLVEHREGRGHNLYFNEVVPHIPNTHPWLIFLDDDDCFETPDALATIIGKMEDWNDLFLWQVRFFDRLVPGPFVFSPPMPGHITGIGFCYHKKHWVDWEDGAYGDYYVIKDLYLRLNPVWINRVLTAMQAEPGGGLRQDLAQVLP